MSDWRRIDIDAFDPDCRLTANDLIPPYERQVTLQELQPKMEQLRTLSSGGDTRGAVQLITQDPPYSADDTTKNQYFQVVLETLSQVRQADIINIVKELNTEQQIVLVKYLYKGMSLPEGQKQGGILLAWFEKLTQSSGVTPIVHYLSDRRTV
ncbi:actin-related protein 2/3 complex subunit 5 [Monosporozyma unispora]|nr:arp2/3 complex subunit [Kazachstania unispora]